MKEIWKVIPGYSKIYSVSNKGRVRNNARKQYLKPYFDKYFRVRLYYYGSSSYLVHRLVAKAFVKNYQRLPEVNHKDFNRKNNNAYNLEWTSRQDNVDHAKIRQLRGERIKWAKLDTVKVLAIRREYLTTGVKLQDLADRYGTTFSNISAVVLRKSWAHI